MPGWISLGLKQPFQFQNMLAIIFFCSDSVGHTCFAEYGWYTCSLFDFWIFLCNRQHETKFCLNCCFWSSIGAVPVWSVTREGWWGASAANSVALECSEGSMSAKSTTGCPTFNVILCRKACLFSAPCTVQSMNCTFLCIKWSISTFFSSCAILSVTRSHPVKLTNFAILSLTYSLVSSHRHGIKAFAVWRSH